MLKRLGFLFATSVVLSACQDGSKTVEQHVPEPVAISLSSSEVKYQDVPRYYSATGYTSIARTIEVSTSQSGTIKQLKVDEGDVLKAGTLLIVIDESELLTAIKQAESAVKNAEINLKDREKDLTNAKDLRASQAVTANYLRKAQVQMDLANSQMSQARSELKRQKAKQPYYRITSPIDARVVNRWVSQGDLAVVGKPLLKLEAIKGLEFETALPVKWLDKIHIGDEYKLRLHDFDKTFTAKISHIVRTANRVTQTCQIKLSSPNSDNLTAGLSGQIDFIVATEKQLLIPETSLIKRAGVQGVFRLDKNNQVQFTPVKTERLWEHHWIVLSGLQEGETVVLTPPANFRDGSPITPDAVVTP